MLPVVCDLNVPKITTLDWTETYLTLSFQLPSFSKKHADSLRAKIFPNKTSPLSYYGPFVDQAVSHGTTHVSVIGPDGDLVSVTR